jgi:2-iminobutanoate/2-iminopropanoate deaminase
MKTRTILHLGLLSATLIAALPLSAAEPARKYLGTEGALAQAQLPFSDAVQAGDTLYLSGTIGIDAATGQAATDTKAEAKLVMDSVQHTLERAGFAIDDVVSVQIYCTNLELYGLFNDIYRTYFHAHFPARAFIGVNQLVRGAHFEVMATAVKQPAAKH